MSLQVKLALTGSLAKFTNQVNGALLTALRFAVEEYGTRLKLQLREDTRAGGLGDGVANAWQEKDYTSDSNKPAALVYSKAPLIVTAFSDDTTIAPHDGHLWLAIPTDNVPRIGHHKMTPLEVEIRFNQDLIFRNAKNAGVALAYVSVIPAKSGKGFRPPTKGRLKQGRKTEMVLMFIMIRQVHLQQRLHWPSIMAAAKDGFEAFIGEKVAEALKD